jgi:hypothetical protein
MWYNPFHEKGLEVLSLCKEVALLHYLSARLQASHIIISYLYLQVDSLDQDMDELARLAASELGRVFKVDMKGVKAIVAVGRTTGDADIDPVSALVLRYCGRT